MNSEDIVSPRDGYDEVSKDEIPKEEIPEIDEPSEKGNNQVIEEEKAATETDKENKVKTDN